MKFLVDRRVGRRVADFLRREGHDAAEVASLGVDPGDEALLHLAARDSRVVVTLDADFGTLVYKERLPHAGVIRLPDTPTAERIEALRVVLERHAAALESGAIITVRANLIRISRTSVESEPTPETEPT